jgi:predicted phage replisome organizer
MAEVKWIKLNVGMFDGSSFKRIKKAKIGGESFRDKLTAVWFELMDFAGKCNSGGQLIESPEIPFSSIEDIAIMIDREPDELNLCMQYYISNRMITVIDDVYMLTNWAKYQNEDGLEKIREQNRIRQKKWYDKQKALPNATPNVRITQPNATDIDIEEDIEGEGEGEKEKEKKKIEEKKKTPRKPKEFIPPTLEEVEAYVKSRGNKIDAKQFFDYFNEGEWIDSKGKEVRNWKQKVITWESNSSKPKSYGRTAEEKNAGYCFNANEDSLDDLF